MVVVGWGIIIIFYDGDLFRCGRILVEGAVKLIRTQRPPSHDFGLQYQGIVSAC